ncbi:MAG: Gldg family protein [Acidobacteriota bacterium]|nr:Gldg family protein [Acidobacteriota bacterium]
MNTNRQEIIKMAGFIGAAMAIAGYVRHTIQEIWGWFNLTLVIVGGILLLASIALNFKDIIEYFRGRSGRLSANMALLTVAVVGLIAIVNFLGYRHHKRYDLTAEGLFSLSDQTKKVLGGLQKDVKVIKFAKDDDPQLADQMNEFKYQSPRISYERIDPQQRPEISRQYAVKALGETVIAAGDRIERPTATDEQSLINAILKVTRESLKTVCFTEGHDEKALAGDYSQVEGKLKGENYLTKTINLAREKQVPSECAVLVVAGPKIPLFQPEVGMIGQYLDGGGKAMLLLDPETDPQLDEVLKKWNVVMGNDYLLDVSGIGQQAGFGPAAPLVFNYGTHPITDRFGRTPTVFPEARSVKVGEGAGSGVNATTLLTTSEYSWGETELKPGVEPKFDEGKDAKGPVSLGVVASKTMGENKEARLIVIGDSDFAANLAFRRAQRNGDLFMNSINWLAQDEDLISIRPKQATNRSVTMSGAQVNTFWWLVVVVLPLGILGIGTFIWWKRK